MKLSIIIPTLNEVKHIDTLLESIQSLDEVEKEIFLVDGGSEDGTQQKIIEISAKSPHIQLVNNPDRFVSNGFNRAYQLSKGDYISLVGAHAVYPKNYFSTCIAHLENGECEAAGGFLRHQGDGMVGEAIAHCMATKFGVGNTAFRTTPKKMYVDSVAFAVYDRKAIEQVGLFDEALIRNQDDEFHYRLNQAGLRILMLPELETIYFVRASIPKLFSQYYQYGFYKPLVFKKVRQGIRLRHLAPVAFIVYLMSLPLVLIWHWWLVPFLIYVLLDIAFSLSAQGNWGTRALALLVYPTLHLAYGLGFLRGLFHWNTSKP